MFDLATATSAINAIKAARDALGAVLNMKVSAEVHPKLIEMQAAVLDAQAKMLDMQAAAQQEQGRILALEQELAALKDQRAVIARMQRRAPFYYFPDDPDPYCPRCVEADSRVIHAIKTADLDSGRSIWECPACKCRLVIQG